VIRQNVTFAVFHSMVSVNQKSTETTTLSAAANISLFDACTLIVRAFTLCPSTTPVNIQLF
jgi:hypothetical protein